jgi:Ca2+/H+ antiporter, TMEM165/GDT1 family
MNLAIAAAVFPIIFIGELPDKTMFASLVMSTRGKPLAVWAGAAIAFAIHVVIATTIGVALFHVVPHRALEGIVAGMFLVGAGLALREGLRERQYEQREERLVQSEVKVHGRRTFTTAFFVIFLAEWGDLTQILTANLAARYHSPFSVGLGAILALWSVAAIAVAGGQTLLRVVNVVTVRFVTAGVLTVLAGYTAWLAIR